MTQGKGILPRPDDRVIKNPAANGYLVAVGLKPDITRAEAEAWFRDTVSPLIDELVAKIEPDSDKDKPNRLRALGAPGERVSSVAIGLAPTFFRRADGAERFDPPLPTPLAFTRPLPPIPGALIQSELLFYVVSLSEARTCSFISGLWESQPLVTSITLDRGYQRLDGTEPFGFADGLRNVRTRERSQVAFIDRDDDHIAEPAAADGGSYMAFMRIAQNPDAFAQVTPESAQEAVIGRARGGTRIDLVGQGIGPRDETTPPDSLPANAHVRKAGPRGARDDNSVFRRGLPFIETTPDGQVKVGLNFVSFQGDLDQFDVMLNDWLLNPHFPVDGAGIDALFDPQRGLTSIEKHGVYFVPPHDDRFAAATLFDPPTKKQKPQTGRVQIRKTVVKIDEPRRRFDRAGFEFEIVDEQGQRVGDVLRTNSAGRAVSDRLAAGKTYTVRELPTSRPNIQTAPPQTLLLDRSRVFLEFANTLTADSPYSA
jgi:Dyp-type peroxidase family